MFPRERLEQRSFMADRRDGLSVLEYSNYGIMDIRHNQQQEHVNITLFTQFLLIVQYSMFQIGSQKVSCPPPTDETSSHQTLQKVIDFKDSQNTRLLSKFTLQHIISLIDRNKICQIEKLCRNSEEGFNIIDFSRSFLNLIQHREEETLYLTIAIIDLFKEIAFFNGVSDRVQFQHITNYICKGILEERDNQYQIKPRLLPHERKLEPTESIRDVEVFAPIVYGKSGLNPIKLSKAKVKADRTKHTGIISAAFYSHSKKSIFCLDSMSQFIGRYNISAQFVGKITPTHTKIKRDALIMSFAYSQRQQRIGALLKNLQLIFWDIQDNSTTEKSFSTAKYSSQQQINIWFLEYHNQWVTSDAVGGLCTWNLETEECGVQVRLKSKVTEICEIRCLNLIAIAQQKSADSRKQEAESKISLYNLVKNSVIMQIPLGSSSLKHRTINSLQFSNTYQILLYGDISKEITLLQINPHFFDATVKGKLIGHQHNINSFILIKKTPTVVSCDDKQKIKIWDLRNFSCVQTLDFEGKTMINRLISMVRIDKFAIAGGRLYIIDIEKREEGKFQKMLERDSVYPSHVYFEPSNTELLVFTKKDTRFYDIETGKVRKIHTGYLDSEQQVTCLKYLPSCRMIILGNHQGNIRLYNKSGDNSYKSLQPHQREITSINYDSQNHLYITASADSNIFIQKQQQNRGGKFETIRTIKDNFFKKEISFCELSVHHNFIAIGALQERMVYVWDYQYCKLLGEVRLKERAEATVIAWINGYSMLVVGDNFSTISIIHISHPSNHLFKMELVTTLVIDDIPTHILVDTDLDNEFKKTATQPSIGNRLIVAGKKGMVYQIDISSILSNYTVLKSVSKRLNYNPERQLNESFISQYGKKLFKTLEITPQEMKHPLEPHNIVSFKAHQDDITCLLVMNLKNKNYCTCSLDKRLKIWQRGGNLICDVNINLSLPYKWQIDTSNQDLLKGRIMFALKILELIPTRNKENISLNEWNALKINTFFKGLMSSESKKGGFVTEVEGTETKKLFNEEFGKDDLDFERAKRYCLKEVGGPRLKQLQAKKRTRSIQKNLKLSQQKAQQQKQKILQQLKQKKIKLDQKQQLMQMFRNPNQNRNSLFKSENKQLFLRLEKLLHKPSAEEDIKENIPKVQKSVMNSQEIRINRHRQRQVTRKHISFEEYYEKSLRNTVKPFTSDGGSMAYQRADVAQVETRWNKSVFGRVLNDLNEKVKWKRLLHTRSYDRKFRGGTAETDSL